MTNLINVLTPQAIVQSYQKHVTIENYITKAKNGFYFGKMISHPFLVSEA